MAILTADRPTPYELARKRVDDMRGFTVHLTMYLFVNGGLFLIDLFTGDGWWFFWPMLGWGIGVIGHAVALFTQYGPMGPNWERRKIDQYVREYETEREALEHREHIAQR